MRILMVSSEAVPFSKSGGLADVASSLSIALATLGNDVRLVIPGYGLTDDTSFVEMPYRLEVSLGTEVETVRFKQLQYQQVTVYMVDHQWFSKRKGIYGDTSFTPYPDNLIRYTLFSKAALALCKELAWIPEILHCHDWTVGFVPALAQQDPEQTFKQTKSVFTIHNLAYQGDFPRMDLLLADMDIDSRFFSGKGIHKRANMLKTGLETAHVLTTVSPTYAKEIQGELQGCGLETLLLSHADNLYGILNGIDTEEWNPTTDGLLDLHYTAEDLTNKGKLKRIMQKRFGLPVEDGTPVVSMISRIADQKGFVELCQGSPCALEQILTDLPVQVLVIGTGDKAMRRSLLLWQNCTTIFL
jgi:starch synthase